MLKLYSFHWDCHRMGSLSGLFVAKEADVEALVGKHVYFGEVLGKHSDIEGEIEEGDITELSADQDFIQKLISVMRKAKSFGYGSDCGTVSGFNPLDYYDPELE